jgi:hypothetical protein
MRAIELLRVVLGADLTPSEKLTLMAHHSLCLMGDLERSRVYQADRHHIKHLTSNGQEVPRPR